MSDVLLEDRAAIDALPLHQWELVDVGLLKPITTSCVVITRDEYVKLVEDALDEHPCLPESVVSELLTTAHTADRFAIGDWVQSERGCGCLIGEYLVARAEIAEHNDALAGRRFMAANSETTSIEERLFDNHGVAIGAALMDLGYRMDHNVREYLSHNVAGPTPTHGTVFIRDE
jgi:hypothetical protein